MHVKAITSKGIRRLYIYETVYVKDPATGKGHYSSKMVRPLGREDELKKLYEDPMAHFQEVCRKLTEEKDAEKNISVPIDTTEHLTGTEDNWKNVGYIILKQLYFDLDLNKFWNWKSRAHDTQYSVDQIFRLLVFGRVLFPGSKRRTFEERSVFYENFGDFSLNDIYDALDIIAENKDALQKWLFDHSQSICTRDMSVAYFDCTNYYFDIGRPDLDMKDDNGNYVDKNGNVVDAKYRKRGPEKNHRPDPIVSMGLLMDRNGIPLAYDLFPGNESEKVHMRPIVNRVKQQFSNCRTIFVADRGLNTSDNIYWINGDNTSDKNLRDGYIYGLSVRVAEASFKEWTLEDDYTHVEIDEKLKEQTGEILVLYKSKSQTAKKKLTVHVTKPNSKKPATKTVYVDQKQMVYYSRKYALKQKADRDAMVARAKDLIANPKKYDKILAAGSAAYVNNIEFDKETGEVKEGRTLSLNEEKIAEQEKYDGYYSIVTSELNMEDEELRKIYGGLSKIESAFKITKAEFNARPVFVWSNDHIDAHFATCFTALVLIRLLQTVLENKYPIGQVLESLRKYACVSIGEGWNQFIYTDEIIQTCGEKFKMDLNKKYRSQQEMRRLLRY